MFFKEFILFNFLKAIDIWAIGCIFAELLTAEPVFVCKEEDIKVSTPYHPDQLNKIFSVMGYPPDNVGPVVEFKTSLIFYSDQFFRKNSGKTFQLLSITQLISSGLARYEQDARVPEASKRIQTSSVSKYMNDCLKQLISRYANCSLQKHMERHKIRSDDAQFNLLQRMLTMDPTRRITVSHKCSSGSLLDQL